MELDNRIARQTYIQLLIETLHKKKKVLHNLLNITEQQESIISNDQFDEALFLDTISLKEKQILTLGELDDGFEKLYESVRDELQINHINYIEEISLLKDLISGITDLSVKLQAMEKRNKSKIEIYFAGRRKGIREARLSNRTVTNYYKAMSNQNDSQSVFYDKKK